MRRMCAGVAAMLGVGLLLACESTGQYDGVARFAGSGGLAGACNGPGDPPCDSGGREPEAAAPDRLPDT